VPPLGYSEQPHLEILIQEIHNHSVGTSSIVVEIEVVTSIWVKIRHERLGVAVVCRRRLVEDPRAVAIAHDIVLVTRDGL